ncbi:MAG: Dam family site-specific DNA-(adenine-N6)-methyltransferase [Bacilli bacterium]|jgi:DNA adenine methylase
MNIISPLKIQGKKTKIMPLIKEVADSCKYEIWIEPFLGSGQVLFSINPKKALVGDNNKVLIDFYNGIKKGDITSEKVREFLEFHGKNLEEYGADYYYKIRSEFNENQNPLYFLFLNRASFNGIIRFNSKGHFNTPFCNKPKRFSKAYVTKIVNQVKAIEKIILEHGDDWTFIYGDWKYTISLNNNSKALLYLDPPYVNRHATYKDDWTPSNNESLFEFLLNTNQKFILSNWFGNSYRTNEEINIFKNEKFSIKTVTHFYHLGGKLENRNSMEECVIINF